MSPELTNRADHQPPVAELAYSVIEAEKDEPHAKESI
jgi:hypothetical protein